MDLVTEAMAGLLPKLVELLKEEHNLQEGVKKDVGSLSQELDSTHAALRTVAQEVPPDLLDEQVRLWANDVRELSYDMEDVVDSFLVHAEQSEPASRTETFEELMKKMTGLLQKGKTHHQIAHAIAGISDQVPGVFSHGDGCGHQGNPASTANISDPCLLALCKTQKEIVGIEGARDEVVKRLRDEGDEDVSTKQLKTLSIFGFGGLGKTTLAKAVYDCLRVQFDYAVFVHVSRSSNMKKVFKDILIELQEYGNASMLDESQLIDKVRALLQNKRICLLHLSTYPRNFMIAKETLIWKWVAQGLINEKPGMGPFESGERYFCELIYRNMIQPEEIPYKGIIQACRVNDTVHDMICSLANKERFVTIVDTDKVYTPPQSNASSLAIHNSDLGQGPLAGMVTSQVRSLHATMCHFSALTSLSSFQYLRVLAIEECKFRKDHSYHLENLGKLLQLRYLGLGNTPIRELPEEIEHLRFLQQLICEELV
ncbi:disease resistance protein RGA5-like [Lolium perenne]|uniref:disease resistance protein RGA5-like n=1 Tax=Lolium perenne TaxID=4522 RepID=UPI0021F699CA|nr:disease resistance protein PIK6-NP-like [Lolium perenne]